MLNENNNLIDQILALLRKYPEGLPQDKLTSEIPFKEAEIVDALNSLIERNRINIIERNNEILLKYRSEKEALKFKDLTKEEISVHELIIQSGSSGISTSDLKMKMHIESSTFINRILKTLNQKLLIKSLKVLNTKNKKVWIGYDIEPSQEVTGGVWCSNQEYDNKLIDVFRDKCYQYIVQQKSVSRQEVLLYIKTINLMQREIKEQDVQDILNILIFDGLVEPIFPEIIRINLVHYQSFFY